MVEQLRLAAITRLLKYSVSHTPADGSSEGNRIETDPFAAHKDCLQRMKQLEKQVGTLGNEPHPSTRALEIASIRNELLDATEVAARVQAAPAHQLAGAKLDALRKLANLSFTPALRSTLSAPFESCSTLNPPAPIQYLGLAAVSLAGVNSGKRTIKQVQEEILAFSANIIGNSQLSCVVSSWSAENELLCTNTTNEVYRCAIPQKQDELGSITKLFQADSMPYGVAALKSPAPSSTLMDILVVYLSSPPQTASPGKQDEYSFSLYVWQPIFNRFIQQSIGKAFVVTQTGAGIAALALSVLANGTSFLAVPECSKSPVTWRKFSYSHDLLAPFHLEKEEELPFSLKEGTLSYSPNTGLITCLDEHDAIRQLDANLKLLRTIDSCAELPKWKPMLALTLDPAALLVLAECKFDASNAQRYFTAISAGPPGSPCHLLAQFPFCDRYITFQGWQQVLLKEFALLEGRPGQQPAWLFVAAYGGALYARRFLIEDG